MSAEPVSPIGRTIGTGTRRTIRRGPRDHLRDALTALAEHHGAITDHREQSWASITFAGTRHHFTLAFAGDEAVDAGEGFIAALPEHEFTIPGQLVADAVITSVNSTVLPHPAMTVECELLLLVDS